MAAAALLMGLAIVAAPALVVTPALAAAGFTANGVAAGKLSKFQNRHQHATDATGKGPPRLQPMRGSATLSRAVGLRLPRVPRREATAWRWSMAVFRQRLASPRLVGSLRDVRRKSKGAPRVAAGIVRSARYKPLLSRC